MNKQKQIQEIKIKLLLDQNFICPLCKVDMRPMESKNRCLDHDHDTGYIRAVLCRNCNSMEGKITGCIRRAKRLLSKEEWFQNLIHHWMISTAMIHPTHKTPEEKKELRRKRAAKRKRNRNR